MTTRRLDKWAAFWLGPIDPLRLDVVRACLGAATFLYMGFRWRYAREWLTVEGFHISPAHLPYFDWAVPLLPVEALPVFGFIFFGSLCAFTLGWHLRVTAWLALAGLVYVSAADQLSFFSPNKICIVALGVFAASTLGGYTRRQGDRRPSASAWPLRVLQATAIIHLFMAGWTKIAFGGEWLEKPYVFWTQVQGTYRTATAAFLLNTLPERAWILMQWGALLFELAFPVLIWSRRTRGLALAGGVVFQLSIAVMMKHLIYFNLIMISLLTLFIDAPALRRFMGFWASGKHRSRESIRDFSLTVSRLDDDQNL